MCVLEDMYHHYCGVRVDIFKLCSMESWAECPVLSPAACAFIYQCMTELQQPLTFLSPLVIMLQVVSSFFLKVSNAYYTIISVPAKC